MRDLLLQSTDCLVVAHGPRNSACAILVPQPEVERTSPAQQSELFTTWPLGKSLIALFFFSTESLHCSTLLVREECIKKCF